MEKNINDNLDDITIDVAIGFKIIDSYIPTNVFSVKNFDNFDYLDDYDTFDN